MIHLKYYSNFKFDIVAFDQLDLVLEFNILGFLYSSKSLWKSNLRKIDWAVEESFQSFLSGS